MESSSTQAEAANSFIKFTPLRFKLNETLRSSEEHHHQAPPVRLNQTNKVFIVLL